MLRLLVRWVLNALALMLIALLLPGMQVSFVSALVVGLVMGAIDAVLTPIVVLLMLPVSLLTLGIFLLVIDVLLPVPVPDFRVDSFWTALFGSILYSILTGIITSVIRRPEEEQKQLA